MEFWSLNHKLGFEKLGLVARTGAKGQGRCSQAHCLKKMNSVISISMQLCTLIEKYTFEETQLSDHFKNVRCLCPILYSFYFGNVAN